MPQMAPILWLFMIITTFFILNLLINMIYFFQQKFFTDDMETKIVSMNNPKTWKW